MKIMIQLEEMGQFMLSIFILNLLPIHFQWWLWIILFLAPDIGMIGYIINTKTGGITYNIFHHKLVAITVFLLGFYLDHLYLEIAGVILYGHSSIDRALGYGLKHADDFKHTHLGWMKEVKGVD